MENCEIHALDSPSILKIPTGLSIMELAVHRNARECIQTSECHLRSNFDDFSLLSRLLCYNPTSRKFYTTLKLLQTENEVANICAFVNFTVLAMTYKGFLDLVPSMTVANTKSFLHILTAKTIHLNTVRK